MPESKKRRTDVRSRVLAAITMVGALAFAALPPATAQSGRSPALSETIDVRVMNVDVVVTDRNGNRVTGLTAADFEVLEGRQRREITNFSEYGHDPQEAAVELPVAPRTVVIFFDAFYLPAARANPLFDSLRTFVNESLRPGDKLMLAVWNGRVSTLHPLSADRSELDEQLELLHRHVMQRAKGNAGAADRETSSRMTALLQDLSVSRVEGGDDHEFLYRDDQEFLYRTEAELLIFQIRRRVAGLQQLMTSLSGADGRKLMLVFSNVFTSNAAAATPRMFAEGMELPAGDVNDWASTQRDLDRLTAAANSANFSLYMFDPVGPKSLLPQAATSSPFVVSGHTAAFHSQEALQVVSTSTGGLMGYGHENVLRQLPAVAADLSSYYSIGYRVTGAVRDGDRALRVRAKNAAYQVRVRSSVVERSLEEETRDKTVAWLFHPTVLANGIDLRVQPGELKAKGRGKQVQLMVRIPIQRLTPALDEPQKRSFALFVAAANRNGDISPVTRIDRTFQLDPAQANAGWVAFPTEILLRPTENFISVAVLDLNGEDYGITRIYLDAR
jgi:VWFA-related protein